MSIDPYAACRRCGGCRRTVLVDAGVVVVLAEAPASALQRGGGGDRLERRSGGVALDTARLICGKPALWPYELVVLGLGDRVRGGRSDRTSERSPSPAPTVPGIQGHERAGGGGRVVGDRLVERLLAGLLQAEVEGELHACPATGDLRGRRAAGRASRPGRDRHRRRPADSGRSVLHSRPCRRSRRGPRRGSGPAVSCWLIGPIVPNSCAAMSCAGRSAATPAGSSTPGKSAWRSER